MALWIRNAGTYSLQGASGHISLVGATQSKGFYSTKEAFCYSSNSNGLTGPHTWSSANAATFPLLIHTQGAQYDPVTDTYLKNNNGQIAEYDSTNTLKRSINITSIPNYNPLDGVFTSLSGEKYIYYLVKSSGELYRLNRDFTTSPVFVTTISPLEYGTPYAIGGFYHQDYLYMMNYNGTGLMEISIQTGQRIRTVFYTQVGLRSSYPMVCFTPAQVIGKDHYFTLSDLNGSDFTMYAITLYNRNPQVPMIESPDGTQTTPGIHDIATPIRWSFIDFDHGDSQSAYQLEITEVATDTIVYDSGKVKDRSTSFNTYQISLKIHELYKWRVRVWDYYDSESTWSRYAFFKTNQRPSIVALSGRNDQEHLPVLGLTPRLHFRYTDPDNDPMREIYIRIYRQRDAALIIYRSLVPIPVEQYFDVPAGALEPNTTYYWTANGFDAYGSPFTTEWACFRTTANADPPLPVSPIHHERTSLKPYLEAELSTEPSGLPQHFQLELSELPDFSLVQTCNSDESQTGWEAHNGREWVPFPAAGVRERTQLVDNSNFEQTETMANFYYSWSAEGITTDDTVDFSAPPNTGSRALRIVQQRPVLSQLKLYQSLHGFKQGDRLQVTATINTVRIAPDAEIRVSLKGINFTQTGIVITERTSTYKQFSFPFSIPSNYSSLLQIEFSIKGAGYTECWLDALTVEVADEPSYQRVRFQPPEPLASKTWHWRIGSYNSLTKGQPLQYSTQRKLTNLLPLIYSDEGQGSLDDSVWGFRLGGDGSESSLTIDNLAHPEGIRSIRVSNQKSAAGLHLYREEDTLFARGKYFLVLVDMKSTYPDCYLEIGEYRSATLQKPDTWETLWLKMPGRNSYMETIKFIVSIKEKAQHTFIAKPRIYEVSEMEYGRIGVDPHWSGVNLNRLYPLIAEPVVIGQPCSFRAGDLLSFSLKKPVLTTASADKFTMNAVCNVPAARVLNRIAGNSGTILNTGYPIVRDESLIFINQPNVYAHLTFFGTGIRWYGIKSTNASIAYVLIDFRFAAQVDQYTVSATNSPELLYECVDLPYGEHTIRVSASPFAHPDSSGETSLTISAFEVITDQKPGAMLVEACNNGFDASPAWEDVTGIVVNGGNHSFANQSKTATQWGVGMRMKITANGTYSPAFIDGFGISFE